MKVLRHQNVYKHLLIISVLTGFLHAEDPVTCNPNRPTFSSSAATTCYQTTELEYGLQLQHPNQYSQPLLLKQGLLPKLELRLGYTGGFSHGSSADVTAGFQARSDPDRFGLSKAIQYIHTFASSKGNLGTGYASDQLAAIFSQDFLDVVHVDVNLVRSQQYQHSKVVFV